MATWIYAVLSVIAAIASAVYFVTKVEAGNKSNKEFFEQAVGHLKELIQLNEKNTKENTEKEIKHLKEFVVDKIDEVKEDIGRLEKKQEESNQIKERLVVVEQSTKSFHKRMDHQQLGISDIA